ncbi:SHOCT domain-containing protein [Epibacterium sp. SM1969]|uniref:SHOCT domain-containing protein n=1 Tax=Tritonibacter aquimaris TaxID=2663379 RepID=A0A844AJV4_9RHOB|nr:SHOCT domain-containing protein [Tritonibacter aquimaris]MQY41720.1 SHOCT domain-containing protein [Tritonibacter aquimaris]
MTAILEEVRRLESARKRGDISPDEFETAKSALLGTVEEVRVTPTARRAAATKVSDDTEPTSNLLSLLVIGFCGAGILTFVLGQLIGDMTIALTLVITVFAAVLVKAAKRLEQ